MELRTLTYADTLCSVPKRFLRELGAPAAYLLSKLCFRQEGANNKKQLTNGRHGKYWFSSPLGSRATGKKLQSKNYRPLQDACFGRTCHPLHALVKKLSNRNKAGKKEAKKVYVETMPWRDVNLNAPRRDKTLAYHVPDRIIKEGFNRGDDGRLMVKYGSPNFSFLDVEQHGTIGRAIVKFIILRSFHKLARTTEAGFTVAFSRNAIADETGLPLSTVSNAFQYFATPEAKTLATTDGGKSFSLLIANPMTDDILKSRGEGRATAAKVQGIKGSYSENPFPVAIVKFPTNDLRKLTAKSLAQVKALHQAIPSKKKKKLRRRGKKPVEHDEGKRPYTRGAWRVARTDVDFEDHLKNKVTGQASNPFAQRTIIREHDWAGLVA